MSFSAGKNLQNNINTTENQTLSNKTLDNTNAVNGAPIQDSTITNASIESPSKLEMKQYADLATAQADLASRSGAELIYVNDIKKTFQVNDDLGTKTLAEISGGQGGVNYIENSDFEQGVDGYSASGLNFTIAQTKVVGEVLRGEASAKLSKTAVDAIGQEISVPFTVSRADLAKKLTISFEYDASDPAYADDDIQIYVKQDPNGSSSVIRINGEDLKGGKGTHYAQFQTDASQTEYELVFKVNSGNLSAYDIIIDDVKVGPTNLAKGVIVTDWEEFNTTGIFSGFTPGVSSATAKYRRVGDSVEGWIEAQFNATQTAGTSLTITLPWGVDATSYVDTGLTKRIRFGSAKIAISGSRFTGALIKDNVADGNNTFVIVHHRADGTEVSDTTWAYNSIATLNSGDGFRVHFKYPVKGWSSEAVTSEDLGGREHITEISQSLTQTLTDAAGFEKVAFNGSATKTQNTVAAWDETNFRINILETGNYDIYGRGDFGTGVDDDANIGVTFYVNGVSSSDFGRTLIGATNGNTNALESSRPAIKLNKGDYVEMYVYWNDTVASASCTLTGATFIVAKRSSPQTILETETVAAHYTTNAGQQIDTNTVTTVIFEDIQGDTHNSMNTSTGVYTVPVSGWYNITAQVHILNINAAFGNGTYTEIVKNGSTTLSRCNIEFDAANGAANKYVPTSINTILNKGDTLEIKAFQNGTNNENLSTAAGRNYFSIARIK
jgi:hypothetical protein